MNEYRYLEDTQELKLELFRDFYQALAEAKLENDQDFFKLNDFIRPTEVVKLIKIMNQHPTDLSISKYPLAHYLLALINTPSTGMDMINITDDDAIDHVVVNFAADSLSKEFLS